MAAWCLHLAAHHHGARTSGNPHTTPLIYSQDGDDHVVVASNGGSDAHPDWYRNLQANPEAQIQVGSEVTVTARTASGSDRSRLWDELAEIWPKYNSYAEKTDRVIPVVVLTPHR